VPIGAVSSPPVFVAGSICDRRQPVARCCCVPGYRGGDKSPASSFVFATPLWEKFPGYPATLKSADLTVTGEIFASVGSKSTRRIPVAGALPSSGIQGKKPDQVALWFAHNAPHFTVSPHLIGPLSPLTLLFVVVNLNGIF